MEAEVTRRKYSDQFKIETVRHIRNSKMTRAEVAQQLGLPEETLQKWQQQIRIDPSREKIKSESDRRNAIDSEFKKLEEVVERLNRLYRQ